MLTDYFICYELNMHPFHKEKHSPNLKDCQILIKLAMRSSIWQIIKFGRKFWLVKVYTQRKNTELPPRANIWKKLVVICNKKKNAKNWHLVFFFMYILLYLERFAVLLLVLSSVLWFCYIFIVMFKML